MNCCGRSSVATAGRGYPNSIWTRSSWNQQSKSAWSHRFITGGQSTCKVGGYTRSSFARDREPNDSHHLDLRCHHANRAPGHSPGLGGQSNARRTSSQWYVSTGGNVVQIDHCTTPALRCNQAGGSAGTLLGTKRKSDPQDRWRTIRLGSSCGSLVSWTGQNTVPFRNCTQPNRTGNLSPQANVQRTSPGQALDLEPGQYRRSHTGIQTEPRSTGSPKPELIHVAPGRVRDGPIISTLTEWLDTQPKGKGKGKNKGNRRNHRRADNEASMDALGDDDMGTEPRSQRRRRA